MVTCSHYRFTASIAASIGLQHPAFSLSPLMTCIAVMANKLLQLLGHLLVMSQHLSPVSVLTGVPGCFHRYRNTGRRGRVQLPGLQTQGGVCNQEAYTVSLSSCAGLAPQEVQLQQWKPRHVQYWSLLCYVKGMNRLFRSCFI